MEHAVQSFAIVHLVTIGLSHVLQPRAWVTFFLWLRERGEAGVFVTAFLSLGMGSIIVAFHNVWSGIPMVLTLFGWAQVLKALIYFLSPSFGLRKMHLVSEERAKLFVAPGVFMLALASLLVYHLLTGP
ncbi:MAG: hypothetical protein AAF657_35360 [Acidobacteriota bacterium]